MATAKDKAANAGAALEGLRQIGSGWHLSVAAAIARGDHKTLGMDRREFASEAGGFKLLDSRQAILDLHDKKMSQQAIAEILGVDKTHTVARVLAEEGRIEMPKSLVARASRDAADETARSPRDVEGTAEDLEEENKRLRAEAEEARLAARDAKQEVDDLVKRRTRDLRDSLKDVKDELANLRRAEELRQRAEVATTEEERARLRKEAEAAVAEMTTDMLRQMAPQVVDGIVASLETATAQLRRLIENGLITAEMIGPVDSALEEFHHEMTVARATV